MYKYRGKQLEALFQANRAWFIFYIILRLINSVNNSKNYNSNMLFIKLILILNIKYIEFIKKILNINNELIELVL